MATPTYAQVISQINTFIVTNHNNEITAAVLNPILVLLTDFTNNTIGDLNTLTTDQKDTIVAAINSLKNNINDISNTGVKLYTGYDDPNVTPPASFNYADFYMQLDSFDNTPLLLWQFDGFEWVISGGGTANWGLINGNLNDQLDLKAELDLKELFANKQNSMAIDGTGVKYPTVDAVNIQANNIYRAVVATGFLDTTDSFLLSRVDDFTLGVAASQFGIAFSQKFKTPPYAPSDGIYQLTARNIPLYAIGLTGTGTAIKFVGYRASDDSIVFSDTQFIQSPSVAQLGVVLVKYSGGVTSFIDATRTTITIPDIAAYSNLDTSTTGLKASTSIAAIAGTLSHSNTLGSLTGISVAWHTSNNDSKIIPALNPTTFTRLSPANALTVVPPTVFNTLDPTQYWNGTALIAIAGGAGVSSVQRLLFTVNGNFVWQYGEATYPNLVAAQNNILQAIFTNILPVGTFAEVGRMAITKGCTDLNSANAQYYPTGSTGGGGTSPISPTAWGFITGSIDDQLDLKAKLDLRELLANKATTLVGNETSDIKYPTTKLLFDNLALKQNVITNPITGIGAINTIPKFTPNGATLGNSTIVDSGTGVGGKVDINNFIGGTVTRVLPSGNTTIGQTFNITSTDPTSVIRNQFAFAYNEDGVVSTGSKACMENYLNLNKTTNQPSVEYAINVGNINVTSTGSIGFVVGNRMNVQGNGTSPIASLTLYQGNTNPTTSNIPVTNFTIFDGRISLQNTVNARGLLINDLFGTTLSRGIELNVSSGAGKHNIYAVGTADNFLNGNTVINGFISGTVTRVLPSGFVNIGQTFNLTGTDATSSLINRHTQNINEDGFALTGDKAFIEYLNINNKSTNQPSLSIVGLNTAVFQNGSGTLSSLTGIKTGFSGSGNGAVGSVYIINTNASAILNTFPITNFVGFNMPFTPQNNVTNAWGIRIGELYGTQSRGIESNVSSGTGKYNIYSGGTASNYFAGNVLIGTPTSNGNAFRLTGAAELITVPTTSAGTYDILTRNKATGVIEKIDSASVGRPYKVYTALVSQSGTSAPTVTVLENTLGGTVVWTYASVGNYFGTLTGAYVSNKTSVLITGNFPNILATAERISNDVVAFRTSLSGVLSDTAITNGTLEIRVYP